MVEISQQVKVGGVRVEKGEDADSFGHLPSPHVKRLDNIQAYTGCVHKIWTPKLSSKFVLVNASRAHHFLQSSLKLSKGWRLAELCHYGFPFGSLADEHSAGELREKKRLQASQHPLPQLSAHLSDWHYRGPIEWFITALLKPCFKQASCRI